MKIIVHRTASSLLVYLRVKTTVHPVGVHTAIVRVAILVGLWSVCLPIHGANWPPYPISSNTLSYMSCGASRPSNSSVTERVNTVIQVICISTPSYSTPDDPRLRKRAARTTAPESRSSTSRGTRDQSICVAPSL